MPLIIECALSLCTALFLFDVNFNVKILHKKTGLTIPQVLSNG
jgi:hypothetical protein